MRADRLLRMLMLLQRHRHLRAAQLATELEVSERTVLRDMEALAAAGVPVWTERGPGGGCHLMDGWNTRASGLTAREAQALFAWSARESTAQLGLGGPLSSALAKVAAGAPDAALSSAEELGEVVHSDRRRWFGADDEVPVLPVLREAASSRRRVRVGYRSASAERATDRVLDPVGVVDHSGRWYLVAEQDGLTRMYRVSRITSAEVLDEPEQRRDRRPLSRIWAELRQRFESAERDVEVVLRVRDGVADEFRRLVRMPLVPDSEVEVLARHDDAEEWRIRVRRPEVVVSMAIMYAGSVEVLAPAWMPEQVLAAARRVVAAYEQDRPPKGGVRPARR